MTEILSEDRIGADILAEFVEVAIHCILYNRGLYPQGVFEKRIKYNVPVQMCLHPGVCDYIAKVIDSVKLLLANGRVDSISVVILEEETNAALEKFVIELGSLQQNWQEKDPHLLQTEQALRGFLLKLTVSDAMLNEPKKEATWTVHVHTVDSTLASVDEQLMQNNFPWMEAEEKQRNLTNSKIVPLKSCHGDLLNMQMYVEESSKSS